VRSNSQCRTRDHGWGDPARAENRRAVHGLVSRPSTHRPSRRPCEPAQPRRPPQIAPPRRAARRSGGQEIDPDAPLQPIVEPDDADRST
jgi:hypothetical protein